MLSHIATTSVHLQLSREKQFVLLCLREIIHPGQQPLESFGQLLDHLDWEVVARIAQNGKVLGLIVAALQRRKLLNDLPLHAQALLMASLLRYERDCALRKKQFAELAELLSQHSIQFVPLKGIALCHSVYTDLPYRVMSDLDLLIHSDDLERIRELLEKVGFTRATKMFRNRWHDLIAEQALGRMTLVSANLDLDLHGELNYLIGHQLLSVNVQTAWQRVSLMPGVAGDVLTLAPEDLIWHLFIHLVEGSAPALVQLLDVGLVLKKYAMPAEKLPTLGSIPLTAAANARLRVMAKLIDELLCNSDLSLSSETAKELEPFLIENKRSASQIDLHDTQDFLSLVPSWRNRLLYCLGFILPNRSYYQGKGALSAFIEHSNYRLSRAIDWLARLPNQQRVTSD